MTFLLLLVLLALPGLAQGSWNICGQSCGLRPLASYYSMSRIVGGTGALPGAWPWIVSIQDPWEGGTGHICGGSLITSQWVLTAAHCFNEGKNFHMWRVVAGASDLTRPGPETQVRFIRRLLIHQQYDNRTEKNDIALLQLDQPVQCGYYVQLACVPDGSLQLSELRACYISGWGSTVARSRGPVAELQEAKVRLIDVRLCNSSRWYRGAIHVHNLCAGYPQGGIDSCQGDSGGPLVCQDKSAEYFWLLGLTSWGKGCARVQQPGIYTSTQHFYRWILAQLGLRAAARATPPAWQWHQFAATQQPVHRPEPSPAPSSLSSCPYPQQKLVEFFARVQELLPMLRRNKA